MTILSDVELLECARDGDQAALAELYVRHRAVARRVAFTACRQGDPDDLVNEAFEKVFAAVRRQAGPTDAFRAYLFVTIRRLAARQSSRNRDEPHDEVPEPVAAAADAGDLDPSEREMITWAFSTLPDRWQAVLWHTAVEGHHPRDIASALGMSSNAVSALAYRAREKLRQAYLQAHLQAAPRPECEPHRSALGAYVRNGLGKRERTTVKGHVDHCASCQSLLAELDGVNHMLARSVLPIFLVPTIGEAVAGGSLTAGGVAGSLPSAAPELVETTFKGGRRLLGLLPETADVTRTAGRVAAAVVVLVALGTTRTLLLENAPDEAEPPDSVVTEDADETTTSTTARAQTPAELETLRVEKASACLPLVLGSDDTKDSPVSVAADLEDPLQTELEVLGLRLGTTLSLGPETPKVPVTSGPYIQKVECDESTDEGDLLVTIDNVIEEEPEPAPEPPAEPPVSVETGDLLPNLAPALVPDIDANLILQMQDGARVEVDTNLNEICQTDAEQQNLVCTIDRALGEVLTDALANSQVEVELDGLGGNVLTLELKEGDVVVDVKLLNLLP